jgi:uncharacterized protein YjiS (DUF1127 family)
MLAAPLFAVRGRQPGSFHRSCATMPKASRPASHPRRLAGLAQTVRRRASWHQTVRTVAEPRATSHEILTLCVGLESEHPSGASISPLVR